MQDTNMLAAMYISQSRIDRSQVDELVSASLSNNYKSGITGGMIFTGRLFAQIIEGPADAVNDLIDKIAMDDRHSGFKILVKEAVDERAYRDWNMGYVILPFADQAITPLFEDSYSPLQLAKLRQILLASIQRNHHLDCMPK